MKCLWSLGFAGWALATAPVAFACGKAELTAFIAAAQNLDKAAAASGQRLIRCPDDKAQAIQWLAFLLDKTGEAQAGARVDDQPVGKSGREGVLARARAGSYQELLGKVDNQDPAFTTQADAQLVLARVLTRKGRFTRGRDAYQFYTKLRPDDDDAETERLYSYIWEGNWTQADSEFRNAERWSVHPEFKAALARGRALIARQSTGAVDAATSADHGEPGEVQAGFGLYRIPSYYDRRTLAVTYTGLIDLRLAAHTISDLALSKTKANANEFAIGATIGKRTGWYAAAHGGYVSLGSDHYTGDISAGLPLGAGLVVEGGTAQTPLDLQMPLAPDAAGLMRDSVFVGLRFRRLLEAHFELQKEKTYKPHEAHTLLGRLPLQDKDGNLFDLVVPLSYESSPQPIADYDTDLRTMTAGAGFDLVRHFASGWRLDGQATYNLAFVTARDQGRHTNQVGVFDLDLNAVLPLDELLHAVVTVRYVRAQDDDFVRRHQQLSSILLGIGYGGLRAGE